MLAFFVSPFASSQPDGLERVAIDKGFDETADGPRAGRRSARRLRGDGRRRRAALDRAWPASSASCSASPSVPASSWPSAPFGPGEAPRHRRRLGLSRDGRRATATACSCTGARRSTGSRPSARSPATVALRVRRRRHAKRGVLGLRARRRDHRGGRADRRHAVPRLARRLVIELPFLAFALFLPVHRPGRAGGRRLGCRCRWPGSGARGTS